MIIQLVTRDTNTLLTCAQENPYCLSTQINHSNFWPTSSTVHTPFLTRRNLIGVFVIAALLAPGVALCPGGHSTDITHLRIGDGPGGPAQRRAAPNAEKAEMMDSSSTQSSLCQNAIEI